MKNFIWGAAITLATMLVSYQYCTDGPGRGFPFAVYTPACGAWFPVIPLDDSKIPQVIDFGALFYDLIFWSAIAGGVQIVYKRKRMRLLKEAEKTEETGILK